MNSTAWKSVSFYAVLSASLSASVANASEYMVVASTAVPGSFHSTDVWGEVLRYDFDGTGPLNSLSSIPQVLLDDPIGLAFDQGGDLFVGNRFANTGNGSISRFSFDSGNGFTPEATITGNGLVNVHDIAFSPSGELFATSRESGAVSRFEFDGSGNAIANGTIDTGLDSSHGLAFSNDGELFVAEGGTRINRYIIDPTTGAASPNGFFHVPGASAIRSLEFNDQNELFVPDHNTDLVTRFIFDSSGNPIQNGTISVEGAIGVDFSPEGELFVASHFAGGIHRFLFDENGLAIANGMIETDSLGSIAVVAIPEPSTGLLICSGFLILRERHSRRGR